MYDDFVVICVSVVMSYYLSIGSFINLYIIIIPLNSYDIAALSSGCGTVSTGYHQSQRSESTAHDHTVTARTGRHHE
jgi:hypothetical protein